MNFRLLFLTLPLPSTLQPPPNLVRGVSLAQRTFSSLPAPAVAHHLPHAATAATPPQLLEAEQQPAIPIDNADLVPIEVKPIDPPPEDDDEVPAGRGLWVMEAVGYLFGIAVFAFLVKLYFSARQNKIPDDNHIQPDIDMVVDEACNFDEVPEPPESSE